MTPAPARSSFPLPRPSATLVLVRDGAPGPFEVLLLQRADRGDQNSLAWVFPGGLVDETDREVHAHFDDAGDASASQRLGVAPGARLLHGSVARDARGGGAAAGR